jgi:GNAT superfamily N-acetyltransferase
MKISIANKSSDAEALAELFSINLTPDYISHSELQGYRALKPGQWANDIHLQFLREIGERLAQPLKTMPAKGNWRGVIEAHGNDKLVGLAFVTISRESAVPFGIIEDIVIDKTHRGAGLGKEMMLWLIDGLRDAGISRVFLESGLGNTGAHHLFEQLGFKQVSIVMMRDL